MQTIVPPTRCCVRFPNSPLVCRTTTNERLPAGQLIAWLLNTAFSGLVTAPVLGRQHRVASRPVLYTSSARSPVGIRPDNELFCSSSQHQELPKSINRKVQIGTVDQSTISERNLFQTAGPPHRVPHSMHAWTFSSAVVEIEEASTFTISHEGSGKPNTLAIPLASHSLANTCNISTRSLRSSMPKNEACREDGTRSTGS